MDSITVKEKLTAKPKSRKGRLSNHRKGYKSSKIIAKGQHKTNKIVHNRILIRKFIEVFSHTGTKKHSNNKKMHYSLPCGIKSYKTGRL